MQVYTRPAQLEILKDVASARDINICRSPGRADVY